MTTGQNPYGADKASVAVVPSLEIGGPRANALRRQLVDDL